MRASIAASCVVRRCVSSDSARGLAITLCRSRRPERRQLAKATAKHSNVTAVSAARATNNIHSSWQVQHVGVTY